MARPSKVEVSAVNIRISADKDRDYSSLLNELFQLKSGVRVHGNTYVAITYFNAEEGSGVISKYSEIDVDGDWFDIEFFDIASDEDIEKISIPENLRPNYSAFYFLLDVNLHVLAFETYSESKSLSSRSVQKYFDEILQTTKIRESFGFVEADIIKSYGEVNRILSLPELNELRLTIKRPNSDDVSGDLARDIEERLRDQNAEEYEETIKSKDEDGLSPNERTEKLAMIAAENGQVSAKSIVNGVMTSHSTAETPLKEVDTFSRDERRPISVFRDLAKRILARVQEQRNAVRN